MEYVKIKPERPLCIDSLISLHYFEYAKDFAFAGEVHDFWELVYADKNELYVTAGSAEFLLNAKQLYIHRPMEFHRVRCNGEKAANTVIVSFSSDCEQLSQLAGRIIDCPPSLKPFLSKIIAEAKAAFSTPLGDPYTAELIRRDGVPFGSEELIVGCLEMFLIELFRAENGDPESKAVEPDSSDSEIDAILRFIEQNVCTRLTFDDICRHFSSSPSYIKKIFRDNVGCGVMEFYNLCRIDAAKQLIREKQMNFTQIADALKYTSVQYFTRAFKRYTNMTPSQYASSVLSGVK